MAKDGIGAPVRRKEDLRFITGRGRYTDDLDRPGQAYAYFLRSPHAHADIGAINIERAQAAAGVVAVFTGADAEADGLGPLGRYVAFAANDGTPMVEPPRRVLVADRVRMVGEPVAVVVAETADQAKDAAELIEIDYHILPAVTDVRDAIAPDAPRIWDDAPNNIACTRSYGDADAVAAAFAQAHHIAKLEICNNRIISNAMEPRSAIGEYDPTEDSYLLHISNQSPHVAQILIAESVLKVPTQKLRVLSQDVGGGFGPKAMLYPEESATPWLARKVGRPVKWTLARTDSILSEAHARARTTTIELAVDADGKMLGLRIADLADMGAYISTFGVGPAAAAQSLLTVGPYTIPAACGEVKLVFTNTVPTDAYRGAGRPEIAYIIDRIVDCAAAGIGMDKAEIRRRNLIPATAMPYQTPMGARYDSGDFPAVFETALEEGDYAGFAARRTESESRGKYRGLGLCSYIEVNGLGPSDVARSRGFRFGTYEPAEIRFDTEGAITLYTATHSHGQGLETAFAQLAAEGLGIPIDEIKVVHGDTNHLGFGLGTVGSRSLMAGGNAVMLAVDKVVEKGKKIAAHMLEAAPADIEFDAGEFAVAGTDRNIGIKDIARAAYYPMNYPLKEVEPGLDEIAYFDPLAATFPFGAHLCEVEIDPDTGTVEIHRYTTCDDFGRIVNPMLVEGQVHGGIVQGVGQALLEDGVYDRESGQILTGSFMDYCMPRADDVPNFNVLERGSLCTTNPLGVKGCGEAGTIGALAAVMNAVVDALAPLGIGHIEMPATPDKIWRTIAEARKNKAA